VYIQPTYARYVGVVGHPSLWFTSKSLKDTQAHTRTTYIRLLTGAVVVSSLSKERHRQALRQNVRSRNTNVWSVAGLIDVVSPCRCVLGEPWLTG